jgi:hypothetical protein
MLLGRRLTVRRHQGLEAVRAKGPFCYHPGPRPHQQPDRPTASLHPCRRELVCIKVVAALNSSTPGWRASSRFALPRNLYPASEPNWLRQTPDAA